MIYEFLIFDITNDYFDQAIIILTTKCFDNENKSLKDNLPKRNRHVAWRLNLIFFQHITRVRH